MFTHDAIVARRQCLGARLCFVVAHEIVVSWISADFLECGVSRIGSGSMCSEFCY